MTFTFGQTESPKNERQFGLAINSSISGIGSISFAPTGLFYKNGSQFELGFEFHPFDLSDPRIWGINFNYKYYPNRIDKIFSLYFITNFNYTNEIDEESYNTTHYITTRNFLSLMGGYGFQLKFFGKAYLGTEVNLGVGTGRSRTVGNVNFYERNFFDHIYLDGAMRVNIGLRF